MIMKMAAAKMALALILKIMKIAVKMTLALITKITENDPNSNAEGSTTPS